MRNWERDLKQQQVLGAEKKRELEAQQNTESSRKKKYKYSRNKINDFSQHRAQGF